MALYTINDIDISAEFGAYFKKGAYDSLMTYPSVKEYLTEEVREENGERTLVQMPRVKARIITMEVLIKGADKEDAQIKSERFLAFLMNAGEFFLHLVVRNRGYHLLFVGGESRRAIKERGETYLELAIQFKQNDPSDVTEYMNLATEATDDIITEAGDDIIVTTNVY